MSFACFTPWGESPWQICFGQILGTGAYSTVYRGSHRLHAKQTAAIKMLGKSTPGNEMENLRQEVRCLELLSSSTSRRVSFFPRLLGVYEDSNHVFVVMEEADGATLACIIQEVAEPGHGSSSSSSSHQRSGEASCVPASEGWTAHIIHKLCEALCLLHRAGLVHRDIKPRNIVVDREKDVLTIVDFGLASTMNEESRFATGCSTESSVELVGDREIVGSLHYVAPEVLSRSQYSTAVDMWALGVIAFLMLSGSYPYSNDQETIGSEHGPSFIGSCWDNVSDEGKDCIRELLSHDPSHRISAQQLRHYPWIQRHQNPSVASSQKSIPADQSAWNSPHLILRDPPNRLLEINKVSSSPRYLNDEETSQHSRHSQHSSSTGSIPPLGDLALYRSLFAAIDSKSLESKPSTSSHHDPQGGMSINTSQSPRHYRSVTEDYAPTLESLDGCRLPRSFSAPALLQGDEALVEWKSLDPIGRSINGDDPESSHGSSSGEIDLASQEWTTVNQSISKRAREILILSSSDESWSFDII